MKCDQAYSGIFWETRSNTRVDFLNAVLAGLKTTVAQAKLNRLRLQGISMSSSRLMDYVLSSKEIRDNLLTFTSGKIGDEKASLAFAGGENSASLLLFQRELIKYIDTALLEILIQDGDLLFSFRLQQALQLKNNAWKCIDTLDMQVDQYRYMYDNVGDKVIDHYRSPFRIYRRGAYSEAIGSEMWIGQRFWGLTGADRSRLQDLPGIKFVELGNGIVNLRAHDEFMVGKEQEELARDIRRALFPRTHNLDAGLQFRD